MDTRDHGSNSQADMEEHQLPAGKLQTFPASIFIILLAFLLILSLNLCVVFLEKSLSLIKHKAYFRLLRTH